MYHLCYSYDNRFSTGKQPKGIYSERCNSKLKIIKDYYKNEMYNRYLSNQTEYGWKFEFRLCIIYKSDILNKNNLTIIYKDYPDKFWERTLEKYKSIQ